MADFLQAYEAMIVDEGGYKLHEVEGDRGGLTYAGIARRFNPDWEGWAWIDRGETPPSQMVRDWYRASYWVPLRGDEIKDQEIAEALFNFAVNSSAPRRPTVAVRLAQAVVGATPDGVLGDKTLAALNQADPRMFEAFYALAKIGRYAAICNNDRSQTKFLLGWVNRTLRGLA